MSRYLFKNAVAESKSPSGLALKIRFGDSPQARWVPKSQIHEDPDVWDAGDHATGDLILKGWIVNKEGWADEADNELEG